MKTKLNLKMCKWKRSKHLGQIYELYINDALEYSFSNFDFVARDVGKIPTEWICVGLVKRCKGGIIHWMERKKI